MHLSPGSEIWEGKCLRAGRGGRVTCNAAGMTTGSTTGPVYLY